MILPVRTTTTSDVKRKDVLTGFENFQNFIFSSLLITLSEKSLFLLYKF